MKGSRHFAGLASDPFTLEGGQWLGTAAECHRLYYYEWKGMTQTGPDYLASTTFDVAAWVYDGLRKGPGSRRAPSLLQIRR